MGTTQSQLFESVEGVIDSVMEGFNGTILAYGQTSSGCVHPLNCIPWSTHFSFFVTLNHILTACRKTHTMEGPTLRDEDMQGVIPRMVDKLFSAIADQDEDIAFTLSVSYFEVGWWC